MSRPQRIRIGTRASQLALVQAEWVGGRIRELVPEADVELVRISTKGDRILDVPLARVGGARMTNTPSPTWRAFTRKFGRNLRIT